MLGVSTALRGHDLFRLLTNEEVEQISRISSMKHFDKGETVYEHNGTVTHLWLCLEGRVVLRLPAPESELGLAIASLGKGEIFGVAGLLEIERYTTSARALTAVELLGIEARPFLRIVEGNPVVARLLMRDVAKVYLDRYLEVIRRLQGVLRDLPLSA